MPFLGCLPLLFPPRRFHFLLNEIKFLSSSISLKFKHICQEANGLANSLAKQGVDKSFPSVDFTICSFFLGGLFPCLFSSLEQCFYTIVSTLLGWLAPFNEILLPIKEKKKKKGCRETMLFIRSHFLHFSLVNCLPLGVYGLPT